MTDDGFFEQLRRDAQALRYEPADDAVWTRLQARISERVQAQPAVTQLLASWFRPVAAALLTLSFVAALSVQWMDGAQPAPTIDAMASASAPSTDLAEAFGVQ